MPLNLKYSSERDIPSMSKAHNLKNGKMFQIHFLAPSRSLSYKGKEL